MKKIFALEDNNKKLINELEDIETKYHYIKLEFNNIQCDNIDFKKMLEIERSKNKELLIQLNDSEYKRGNYKRFSYVLQYVIVILIILLLIF